MINPASFDDLAAQLEMAGNAILKAPNAKIRSCAQHLISAAASCKAVSDYVVSTNADNDNSLNAFAQAVNAMKAEFATQLQVMRDQILVLKSDIAKLNGVTGYDSSITTYDSSEVPYSS